MHANSAGTPGINAMDTVWEQAGHERAADQFPPWRRKMPPTTISRRPRLPAMLRSIRTTSVAIELDQPLVADPEVMRDLVEHDVPDLAA